MYGDEVGVTGTVLVLLNMLSILRDTGKESRLPQLQPAEPICVAPEVS